MRIYYDRGIIIEHESGDKLYLDPELSSNPIKYPTFVTHAHSDHTAALSGAALTYLTQTTLDLYSVTSKRNSRNYQTVELNEPFEVGSFEVEFLNAGHLLGAAQILVRSGSSSFLYTGDFCPEDLLTINGAEIPKDEVDVAIVDTTYGDQLINFNARPVSRQRLFVWLMQQLQTDRVPIINVGHLGGAQEVISYLNNLASNLPILVSNKISKVNKIYESKGISLDYEKIISENDDLVDHKCVILVPRSFKDMEKLYQHLPSLRNKPISRCIITGQTAKYGFGSYDYSSALSTHAHYDELIDVIKQLNPKHTLAHYGYHEQFAESLIHDHNYSADSFSLSDPIDLKEISSITKPKVKSKMRKNINRTARTELDQPKLDDFI